MLAWRQSQTYSGAPHGSRYPTLATRRPFVQPADSVQRVSYDQQPLKHWPLAPQWLPVEPAFERRHTIQRPVAVLIHLVATGVHNAQFGPLRCIQAEYPDSAAAIDRLSRGKQSTLRTRFGFQRFWQPGLRSFGRA